MLEITKIKMNPRNSNRHSQDQIIRLAKIIEYQGFRDPLMISNRSGLLVSGHGRLQAAQLLGMKEVPVCYQDFESEEQEYAALVSENAIGAWAELDFSQINSDIAELGPFDLDMLGIKNFKVDPSEIEINEKELDENIPTDKECPSCGYVW